MHHHRNISTVLLDLDDCLYQIEAIPRLMLSKIQGMPTVVPREYHPPSSRTLTMHTGYMEKELHIPPADIAALSSHFYMQFGTTLAGLVVWHAPKNAHHHAAPPT